VSAALLATDGLVAGYSAEVDILSGVSIDVGEGEIVCVVGPNGAGKSTLMKAVFGLVTPKAGHITLGGRDITGLRPSEIARLGMAYVPQRDNVFESMTVLENLELGATPRPGLAVRPRIEALLALFPRLAERRRQAVGTMSGGERQMVAMARALMPEPAVLLLDEPSAGLAPLFVDLMFEQVQAINRASVTVLMVEQNARRALALSHRGYVLDLGQNRFAGEGRALLEDPRLAELYLG
jgi:neutral amino acid transport system ATP-binding protein